MCSFDTTNALPRADPHHTPHTPSTSNFFIPKRNGTGLNKFPMLISGATVRVVPFLLNPICIVRSFRLLIAFEIGVTRLEKIEKFAGRGVFTSAQR